MAKGSKDADQVVDRTSPDKNDDPTTIRFSKRLTAAMEDRAKQSGRSVSEYVRELVVDDLGTVTLDPSFDQRRSFTIPRQLVGKLRERAEELGISLSELVEQRLMDAAEQKGGKKR